jgi:hypothetical protein
MGATLVAAISRCEFANCVGASSSEVEMSVDVVELVGGYLADDPTKWAKLASNIRWRRLQLLLMREILVELRKLRRGLGQQEVEGE